MWKVSKRSRGCLSRSERRAGLAGAGVPAALSLGLTFMLDEFMF